MTLVLGLGIIGSRSADQLTAAGHSVKTWNRTPKERPDYTSDLENTAQESDTIICYLKDALAVRETFLRLCPTLKEGKCFINHATIDPQTTLWLANQCRDLGCEFLDAPFTGSRDAAAGGNLTYYVAGDPAVLEKHRSLLEITSKAILFLGAPPAATVVKITTNLVTASAVQALTEALEISRHHGVDPRAWHEAAKLNGCYAMVHGMKIPTLLDGDYTPHFSTENMLKDVRYSAELASEAGLSTPLNSTVIKSLEEASQNSPQDDFSSLIKNQALSSMPATNSLTAIRLTGPDSERYLNGQVSNDVSLATETEPISACLLDAKGKLQASVNIVRDGDDFLVLAHSSLRDDLMPRLDRYLIADQVELIDESGQHDERLPQLDEATRISKGIPAWPNELFPGLLPPEAAIEESHISYTKGCYTGQEVISRMKRAGKTNKHLIKLTLDRPLVPTQSKLLIGEKEAGWITSVATLTDGTEIALGYRLRKFETEERFDVQSPSSSEIIATATLRS